MCTQGLIVCVCVCVKVTQLCIRWLFVLIKLNLYQKSLKITQKVIT